MTDTSTMAIRIHENGGPEVMRWEEAPLAAPGDGEVLLRHTFVGLNYVDVGMRAGTYPVKIPLPSVIGMEAAGVVEEVGPNVSGFAPGDRVSYCMTLGSYAERRTIPAHRLIKLDDRTPDEIAAASTLQGLTAHYLLHESYRLKAGDTALVHAAAGGMGLFLCQWAKHIGATVIGTVSTPEKAALAKAHGCDHPILYTETDFAEAVLELTGGEGVNVIYDAVGKDTFMKGLGVLAERGTLASYGYASGPVGPVDLLPLGGKALTIARGGLGVFIKDPEERARNAAQLFGLIADGTIRVEINQRYALSDAVQAHKDLEGRKTTGSTVFTV